MPGSHHWSWSSRYEPADHWWTRTARTLPRGLQQVPDRELVRQPGALELADVRAVQPHPGARLDPVEAQHGPAVRVGPVGRQVEDVQMVAGRVLRRHPRRVHRERVADRWCRSAHRRPRHPGGPSGRGPSPRPSPRRRIPRLGERVVRGRRRSATAGNASCRSGTANRRPRTRTRRGAAGPRCRVRRPRRSRVDDGRGAEGHRSPVAKAAQPLMPVWAIPCTSQRWRKRNTNTRGRMEKAVAMKIIWKTTVWLVM